MNFGSRTKNRLFLFSGVLVKADMKLQQIITRLD